eukprot:g10896.t1
MLSFVRGPKMTRKDADNHDISGRSLRSELVKSDAFAELRAEARELLAARRQADAVSENKLEAEAKHGGE